MSFRPQLGQPVTHRFLRRGTTEHNYDQPKREAIRQLLESKGYKRVRSWAEDDWYLLHGRYKANLDWGDADLFNRQITIRRSKTEAGLRAIPLNGDALAALARLRARAEGLGYAAQEHFVFPACERNRFDPMKPQKTWRTACLW